VGTSYSSDAIVVLEGLEAVRRRPGMFIPDATASDLGTRLVGRAARALWGAASGATPDLRIALGGGGAGCIGVSGAALSLETTGGVPLAELIVRHLTHRYSPGWQASWPMLEQAEPLLHLNALSTEFELTIADGAALWRQESRSGVALGPLQRAAPAHAVDTNIRFVLDGQLVPGAQLGAPQVRRWLAENLPDLAITVGSSP
jgi:hypothetical protein